eukprot:CAMPEP_0168325916 /NCGR_PEP_ID=MMETSP0213-20121227/4981_1 /TAXON_ID=151035 /ORGANISM="Euplotes harpa, Strain FSP1.4" /LENGTH=186 /DNA_ID=CAMNT_0008328509 /DNA_START=16 /DNA_END=573 /DNA_ORIENTATION=-
MEQKKEFSEELIKKIQLLDTETFDNKYDKIAPDYEKVILEMGYDDPLKEPPVSKQLILLRMRRSSTLAAAPALVGKYLKEMGYTNIVGLDASPEMLEEAKAKDAYVELVERFLCIPEGIPDSLKNRFEGVTAAGVLFLGYMGAEVFDEMLEMLKPGGYASFTSREDLHIKMGYHDKIEKLVEEGKW